MASPVSGSCFEGQQHPRCTLPYREPPITKVTCLNHASRTDNMVSGAKNGGRSTRLAQERRNMARKPLIRIALVENDPLRVVGFRTLFKSVSGFELVPVSLSDIRGLPSIDLVLLSDR